MNVTDRYLLRMTLPRRTGSMPAEFSNRFATISERSGMDWKFVDPSVPHWTLILVSKFDHCLNDLLHRKQTGELNIDVTTLASNHPALRAIVRFHQVPFKVLSANRLKLSTRAKQEVRIRELIEGQGVDLVILARYTQVLSNEVCQNLVGLHINIHHSFSSSSKGVRRHHKACKRGVKAIGATAHCVRLESDEGPIIDQEVASVDHTCGLSQLLATGRNVETYVRSWAAKAYSEHRLLLNEHKTAVLK